MVMIMSTATIEGNASPAIGPRDLGGTGAVVHPIGLDGALFGWVTGSDETARVLDIYSAAGGNLICTADHYAGGRSEIMIGSWLSTVRDRSSVTVETRIGRHPDAAGLSRRSILRAVENSLTRLGTDYVDFLTFDGEDPSIPLDESLDTAQQLIGDGKVRFLSASKFSADRIREVAARAGESNGPRFRAVVLEYNLMDRQGYERDLEPLATQMHRGALARLPLASGYLTGEFRTRDDLPHSVMFDGAARHIGRRGERIIAALSSVAKDLGETPTKVALAWVLLKPGIAAAIFRAQNEDQLLHAMGATALRLERQHLALLDRASVL
jgi:aryl-alcohol dehydrogenase-like predicted oxidoreductase